MGNSGRRARRRAARAETREAARTARDDARRAAELESDRALLERFLAATSGDAAGSETASDESTARFRDVVMRQALAGRGAAAALGVPPAAEKPGVHILVAAVTAPGTATLAHDVRLLKAALLYADRVTLCSVSSTVLLALPALADLSEDERLDFVERVAPAIGTPAQATLVRESVALLRRIEGRGAGRGVGGPIARQFARDLRRTVADALDAFQAQTARRVREAGAGEIAAAVRSGLVAVHPFRAALRQAADGPEPSDPSAPRVTDAMVTEFVDVVLDAVRGGGAYPLLDDLSGGLVDAAVRTGALAVPAGKRQVAQSVHLAARLFDRLPTFDDTPVDELLDVRRALDAPLARFRAALLRLSATLGSAPWNAEFPAEADLLVAREVEPQLADLEDALRANKLIGPALRSVVDKPLAGVTGGVLGFGIAQASHLPHVIATAVSGALGAAPGLYDAYRAWDEQRQKLARHELYFYHRVRRDLG